MSDDTIPGPSPEGSPQETLKGRRLGIILCAVSAIATFAAGVFIAGRLFPSSVDGVHAPETEDLREHAPAPRTRVSGPNVGAPLHARRSAEGR